MEKYIFRCAKSFCKIGLSRFDTINIIGFNATEYAIAFFGCIFAGGISVGIYTTNSAMSCLYSAESSKAKFIIVDGYSQLQKYLDIKENYRPSKYIMY